LLKYTHRDELVEQRINFIWTTCNYGGKRVWFICPSCGKRVAVIYLGCKYFASIWAAIFFTKTSMRPLWTDNSARPIISGDG
jgi:hypothetical protein